jgi:hypothetical protein
VVLRLLNCVRAAVEQFSVARRQSMDAGDRFARGIAQPVHLLAAADLLHNTHAAWRGARITAHRRHSRHVARKMLIL